MEILYPRYYLLEELACKRFIELLMLDYVVEQLTAWHVLHDQVELSRSFDDLIQLHDVRVSGHLEDFNFSSDPLYINIL